VGKVSVKTASVTLFLCGIVLFLCTCAQPLSVDKFKNDKQVQEIIGSANGGTVILGPGSEPGLIRGNRIISGLDPNKYYMVVSEFDADGNPVTLTPSSPNYPLFVTEYPGLNRGQLVGDLKYITRISGKTITGLTNLHTYTVQEAAIGLSTSPPVLGGTSTYSSGKMTIIPTTGTISLTGLDTNYNGYQVMAVAVNPATLPTTSTFNDKKTIGTGGGEEVTSFALEGPGTTVDYVFYKKAGTSIDFRVLQVVIGSTASSNGTGTFNITFQIDDEYDDFSVVSGSTTISKSALFGSVANAATVSLTIDPPTSGGNWASVSWSINGTTIGAPHLTTTIVANDTLTINNSATFWEFLAGSSFNVNVTVSKGGGVPYTPTTPITITVSP